MLDMAETHSVGEMTRAVSEIGEKAAEFANELKRFSTSVQEQSGSLHGRYRALGDSWQDQEQEAFSEEFESLMRTLSKFVEASEQHVPYLLQKADRLDDYLNQR